MFFSRPSVAAVHRARADMDAVLAGGWEAVDLTPLDALAAALTYHISQPGTTLEGHSAELKVERKLYYALTSMPSIRTICEIGFNAGHSAALWLLGAWVCFVVAMRAYICDVSK